MAVSAGASIKKCVLCGESFSPNKHNQKYCKSVHYKKCENCGKEFGYDFSIKNFCIRDFNERITCSRKCTNLMKYGTNSHLQSLHFKEKSKKTKLEKYGNEKYTNKEKTRQTNLEKYGIVCTLQDVEISKKSRQTMFKKYGVKYSFQSDVLREKAKKTSLEKYGNKNYNNRSKAHITKIKKGSMSKFFLMSESEHIKWVKDFKKNKGRKPTFTDATIEFGYAGINGVLHVIDKFPDVRKYYNYKDSYWELKICDFLDEFQIEYQRHNYSIISPKEIDIYLPDLNLGIEINDIATHNSLFKPPTYHLDKTIACRAKGIQLLHLWEWNITNPIKWEITKSMLLAKLGKFERRLHAGSCDVIQIDAKTASNWYETTHIQGKHPAQTHHALWHRKRGEIVAVMSWGSNELVRFSSALNTQVIEGYSKLFNATRPNGTLVTYSFNDYSDGDVYQKGGWTKVGEVSPRYWWTRANGDGEAFGEVTLNRRTCQKKNISRMWPDYYDYEDKSDRRTEIELMEGMGFVQVFDSGKVRWEK